ncbi:hypothetical protein B0T21DRAFT_434223 [Apiosordaria backusii]|uniref:Uncharacterized protein n=1 Tax=Apiosordaria backusii TaxID=314023 RepID=A0AA40EMY9_9PEZI|nr:hypothetical protein B0T21DRAFT_434223 [Apiosordaria backusii]
MAEGRILRACAPVFGPLQSSALPFLDFSRFPSRLIIEEAAQGAWCRRVGRRRDKTEPLSLLSAVERSGALQLQGSKTSALIPRDSNGLNGYWPELLAPLPPTQGAALTQLRLRQTAAASKRICEQQLECCVPYCYSELVSGLTVPDDASGATVSSVPTVIHLTTVLYLNAKTVSARAGLSHLQVMSVCYLGELDSDSGMPPCRAAETNKRLVNRLSISTGISQLAARSLLLQSGLWEAAMFAFPVTIFFVLWTTLFQSFLVLRHLPVPLPRGCGFRFPECTTTARSDFQIPGLLVTYFELGFPALTQEIPAGPASGRTHGSRLKHSKSIRAHQVDPRLPVGWDESTREPVASSSSGNNPLAELQNLGLQEQVERGLTSMPGLSQGLTTIYSAQSKTEQSCCYALPSTGLPRPVLLSRSRTGGENIDTEPLAAGPGPSIRAEVRCFSRILPRARSYASGSMKTGWWNNLAGHDNSSVSASRNTSNGVMHPVSPPLPAVEGGRLGVVVTPEVSDIPILGTPDVHPDPADDVECATLCRHSLTKRRQKQAVQAALHEPNLDPATRGLIYPTSRAKQRTLRIVTALSRLRSRRSSTQTFENTVWTGQGLWEYP